MFQRLPKKIVISSLMAVSAMLMTVVAAYASPPIYDTNINNRIELGEVLVAINDYLDEEGNITRSDVLELINIYLDDAPIVDSDSLVVWGFKCTGSMNPTITCLDTATHATSFAPKDIRVGTIVSGYLCYDPNPNELLTTHRVTELRGEGDSLEVRTQGDANKMDDGCWVPFFSIEMILIELHKDTAATPANIEMRRIVQEAKAAWEEAERKVEEALAVSDAAWEMYKAEWERLCGIALDSDETCTLPQSDIDYLADLYQMYSDAYDA